MQIFQLNQTEYFKVGDVNSFGNDVNSFGKQDTSLYFDLAINFYILNRYDEVSRL